MPNLTIFKVDGLPAALGDFVYEPILQVLARTPLPNLRDLTLASYTGRPMDPRQLAVTLCKFPTVTRLTMCLVAWCAEPDLCDALAALPLSMLSAQGVDGPVFQHLAAALQGRDTSITFLWLRGCPMVTLTELHTFTTILQHSLNTLIFEPSTTSTLPMTPFSLPHLRELIFRVHTPWAFDFLHLFHFCPIRRLVLGSFQTEHWASGLAEAGVVRELQGLFKARAAGWSGSGTGGARESMELILEVPGWEGGAELTEREEGLSRLLERWGASGRVKGGTD